MPTRTLQRDPRARCAIRQGLASALVGAALLAGCGGNEKDSSRGGGMDAVAIEEFEFQAERVEVDAGTRVTWTNRDAAPHTATAADVEQRASFDTQVIREGKSAGVTFDKPGEYAYICDLHPFMKGTVVVR